MASSVAFGEVGAADTGSPSLAAIRFDVIGVLLLRTAWLFWSRITNIAMRVLGLIARLFKN